MAVSVLPPWLQPKKIQKPSDWKKDLHESAILLAVLLASNGDQNHAITIHGGFIYDTDKKTALHFNKEAMDYCVSPELRK